MSQSNIYPRLFSRYLATAQPPQNCQKHSHQQINSEAENDSVRDTKMKEFKKLNPIRESLNKFRDLQISSKLASN
jgi:hypothetical protein